ncbi:MAG: hypothetical protein K0U45_00620 [Alphaproteobacteria bacterium]|nr:hypothetical protein [Alphaproteobacteria bacterium]
MVKKQILLIVMLLLISPIANARDGVSLSLIQGKGVNTFGFGGGSGVNLDDDSEDFYYWDSNTTQEEWEKTYTWKNSVTALQYRKQNHAIEFEQFSAKSDYIEETVRYKDVIYVTSDNGSGYRLRNTTSGTIFSYKITFSGQALSYIYYPSMAENAKLQPFFKMGRTDFNVKVTQKDSTYKSEYKVGNSIIDTENANGVVFGSGLAYHLHDAVDIIIGIRFYSGIRGAIYSFNDIGLRYNF